MKIKKKYNLSAEIHLLKIKKMKKYFLFLLSFLMLAGCSTTGTPEVGNLSPKAQAVVIKQYGGVYKIGNPYKIMGRWYYPKEDYNYSEVGMASWYGDDFHAKKTANGEKYDMNTLTAAHRTLPLPSIVKVTNLENGRSLVVRVNDRGPYAKERIIDLSKRAAGLLGYQTKGTAKVKVEIMAKESKALKAAMLGQEYSSDVIQTVSQNVLSSKEDLNKQHSFDDYFIQVGSFKEKSLADCFEKKIKTFGQTSVANAEVNGSQYYRVRLGPISTKDIAEEKLSEIQSNGFHDARIVH